MVFIYIFLWIFSGAGSFIYLYTKTEDLRILDLGLVVIFGLIGPITLVMVPFGYIYDNWEKFSIYNKILIHRKDTKI